jgi:hypothetical protein
MQTEAVEEVDGGRRSNNFPAILEQWRQKERTASGSSASSSGSSRSFDSDLVQPLTRSVMAISRVPYGRVADPYSFHPELDLDPEF